jgi:hypothetical protein
MKLLGHHELDGFGGIGEGCNMQMTKDGRRILWLAHESAPKNFTGVDVSDPLKPKVVVQTDLPHSRVRSNSLDIVGDIMAVAYQTNAVGLKPAGMDLFDVSVPEKPKLISHFDASGEHSQGAHCLWFVDGEYIHLSCGAPDFHPRDPKDHQIYRIVDVRNPSKPVEVGRWWYPGQREGDSEAPMPRHPKFNGGYRPHNMIVYPERPDRAHGVRIKSWSARSSTPASAPTTSPMRFSRRRSPTSCPVHPSYHPKAPFRSTTSSSTIAGWCSPWIASAAASTFWR